MASVFHTPDMIQSNNNNHVAVSLTFDSFKKKGFMLTWPLIIEKTKACL